MFLKIQLQGFTLDLNRFLALLEGREGGGGFGGIGMWVGKCDNDDDMWISLKEKLFWNIWWWVIFVYHQFQNNVIVLWGTANDGTMV